MVNKLDQLKRGTAYHTGDTTAKNTNPQIRIDQLEKKTKKDIELAMEKNKEITLEQVKEQLDALWLEIDRTKINALGASNKLNTDFFEEDGTSIFVKQFQNAGLATNAKSGVESINELKVEIKNNLDNQNKLAQSGELIFNLIQANKLNANHRKLICTYGVGTMTDLTKFIAMPNQGDHMNNLYSFSISRELFGWHIVTKDSNIYLPKWLFNYFNYVLENRDLGMGA